jgi:hypothetical protein
MDAKKCGCLMSIQKRLESMKFRACSHDVTNLSNPVADILGIVTAIERTPVGTTRTSNTTPACVIEPTTRISVGPVVPHTDNSPESVFWILRRQKTHRRLQVATAPGHFDVKRQRKITEGCKRQQSTSTGGHPGSRFQPAQRQKTPIVEHKGSFSGGVVFLVYPPRLQ